MSSGEVKQINGKRVASPEYRSWQMMKNRCLNPNAEDYRYYGARGISVCKRWHAFDNFLLDMGRKAASKLTLERKNNNRGYSKSNCVWATRQHQAQNRNYCRINVAKAGKIRKSYAAGIGDQTALAKKFGVTQVAVSQILRGLTWKNADGPTVYRSSKHRIRLVGELNGRAKITNAQIAQMRELRFTQSFTQKELGRQFGLSQTQVSKILARKEVAQCKL